MGHRINDERLKERRIRGDLRRMFYAGPEIASARGSSMSPGLFG